MKKCKYIFVAFVFMLTIACKQDEPISDFNLFISLCQDIYKNDSLSDINISEDVIAINYSSTTTSKIIQKSSINQLDSELINILEKLSKLKISGFSRFDDHIEFYKDFPLFYTGKCYSIWYYKAAYDQNSVYDGRRKIGDNIYVVYCNCWSI